MMVNKDAQFFLLAAVIISAVVISLGVTSNKAIVSNEPNNFYDFSYEVKKEAGAVIDYEIYSNVAPNNNLSKFVDLLAVEISEKTPNTNFVFIYGDSTSVDIRNYGSSDISVDNNVILGVYPKKSSNICIGGLCKYISNNVLKYNLKKKNIKNNKFITVGIKNQKFKFSFSKYRQVIFIMQKDVNNESFVTIA